MRCAIVIEPAGPNVSACVPDLPGCSATGATAAAAEAEIRQAIRFRADELSEACLPALAGASLAAYAAT